MLGTFVEMGAAGPALHERAFEAAYAAIGRVEQLLSFQSPGSDLSRLNRCAGTFVRLSPVAVRVLRLSRAMSTASDGLFNCTIGGALVHRGTLPDHGGPQPILCGNPSDIEIRGCEARLLRPVRVTLDGIAKGYAVDLAIGVLKRHGAIKGWINAGGDMRAFGSITLPISRRESNGSLQSLGGMRDAAIATSEIQPERNARFPGEVLDRNGCRAPSGVWTVLSSSAWRADALTKVAALAPASQRDALLSRLGGRLIDAPSLMQ